MSEPSEPLVLLPGMNCDGSLWHRLDLPVAPRFAELRGTSIDDCVDALLDDLPERFSLAGLSLGGIVAMAMARRAPERIARLALIATNAAGPTDEQRNGWRHSLDQLRDGTTSQQLQQQLLDVLFAERTVDLDECALAMAARVGTEGLRDHLRIQLTRVDERPGLREVTVPTLVLHGDHDRLCPVERHREIAALVPTSHRITLPGAGHLLPLERPREVGRAIGNWLSLT